MAVQSVRSAGTFSLEISNDGSTWFVAAASITTSTFTALPSYRFKYLRMNISVAMGASDKLILGGELEN
jgi:hypothetical protein